MASVGQVLSDARTSRGIGLDEVERVTKIRVKFLRAMEQDDWDELPGPPYTTSFLSTYARFLELDDQALVERYKRTAESAEGAEPIPRTVIHPGSMIRPRSVRPPALIAAGLVAAIALVLVIAVSLGGSEGGNGGGKGGGSKQARAGTTTTAPSGTETSTGPSTTTASEVSLELHATGLVWVCVVDGRGRTVVPGETLSADESRGPFSSRDFEVNVGNGSVAISADGQPVDVPPLAEPLGYRVTPEGVQKLAPSERPTCA